MVVLLWLLLLQQQWKSLTPQKQPVAIKIEPWRLMTIHQFKMLIPVGCTREYFFSSFEARSKLHQKWFLHIQTTAKHTNCLQSKTETTINDLPATSKCNKCHKHFYYVIINNKVAETAEPSLMSAIL